MGVNKLFQFRPLAGGFVKQGLKASDVLGDMSELPARALYQISDVIAVCIARHDIGIQNILER
jgi:hypothetical protein